MNSWVGGEGSPNVYSGSDWTKWENAGAVFLPITGNRQGSSFGGSIAGFYWISTRHSGDKAKCLYFTKSVSPSSVLTNYDLFRGHAVRLVRDAN